MYLCRCNRSLPLVWLWNFFHGSYALTASVLGANWGKQTRDRNIFPFSCTPSFNPPLCDMVLTLGSFSFTLSREFNLHSSVDKVSQALEWGSDCFLKSFPPLSFLSPPHPDFLVPCYYHFFVFWRVSLIIQKFWWVNHFSSEGWRHCSTVVLLPMLLLKSSQSSPWVLYNLAWFSAFPMLVSFLDLSVTHPSLLFLLIEVLGDTKIRWV